MFATTIVKATIHIAWRRMYVANGFCSQPAVPQSIKIDRQHMLFVAVVLAI